MALCKSCIICGEAVELTPNEERSLRRGLNIDDKVCDKCREAILYMRKQAEFVDVNELREKACHLHCQMEIDKAIEKFVMADIRFKKSE